MPGTLRFATDERSYAQNEIRKVIEKPNGPILLSTTDGKWWAAKSWDAPFTAYEEHAAEAGPSPQKVGSGA